MEVLADQPRLDDVALRAHLIDSALAGEVATSPRNTIENCGKMVSGNPDYDFGLPDWRDITVLEALSAIRDVCGNDPGGVDDLDGPGFINPDATMAGIAHHTKVLAQVGASGDAKVLLATGHPTGLLPHYATIGRWLRDRGSLLLTPAEETWITADSRGRRTGVRYVAEVACVFDGGALRHTHRSLFMEAMLEELGNVTPDLVIGDHGMAGAAVAAGIQALSIADVNDPALPVAQVRGRTAGVLPIDDNLAPRLFAPVTAAMLR